MNAGRAMPFLLLAAAHLVAAGTVALRFRWDGLALALGLHFLVACLGISVGYHRVLAHRAARLWWPLEYAFALLGSLALHGDPVRWVTIHRQHHRFADTDDDPHTPRRGFWDAHFLWTRERFLAASAPARVLQYAPDLEAQAFYRVLRDGVTLRLLLQALPLALWLGVDGVLWGLVVRYVVTSNAIWSVNSVGHGWGFRAYRRDDQSTNHVWVALASFGEGWHNNHHAFPRSARFGLRPWQLDLGWWSLRGLERLGLAHDLRQPEAAEVACGSPATSWGELLGVRRPRMEGCRAQDPAT